jgi:hypothetical protein
LFFGVLKSGRDDKMIIVFNATTVSFFRMHFYLIASLSSFMFIIVSPKRQRLYKTLIRPVIAYGAEAWVMNKCDENMINIFEREILRNIFGAVREGGYRRARYNNELYGLYREQDLVSYNKVGRMRWTGHVSRMEDSDPAKQAMKQQLYGIRRAGRPKLRWVDSVAQDARNMGIKNWKKAAQDRTRWRRLQAKTRQGL